MDQHWRNPRFIIQLTIYLILISGFGWQIMDQVEKFFKKKTTMTTSFISPANDNYPTVSMCFGFKPEIKRSEIMNQRNIENWKENQTLQAMNATYRNQTFDLTDILQNMTCGQDYASVLDFKVGQTWHNKSLLEVIEVYSDIGRCYTIFLSDIITENVPVRWQLNSKSEIYVDIFYNRWGQQGVISGYWPLKSESITLKAGFEYSISVKKNIVKHLSVNNNDCMEDEEFKGTNYDELKCKEAFTKESFQRGLAEKGAKLCWIPQADFFIRMFNNLSIVACRTKAEMIAVKKALENALMLATYDVPGCKCPCTTETVAVSSNKFPIYTSDDYIDVYFVWEDTTVKIEEEYLLMDFNSIVSAIGGSLGLFLGFSCLDCLMQILHKFETLIRRLC